MPNVLVVDDEIGPRESLRMILKPNYNVFTAEDGHAALQMLGKAEMDVITLDLKMPGMSGVEVLRQIRSSERLRRIPVVVITSSSLDTDMREALNAGADAFAHKAFDMVRFNREIHMLLTEWLHV